LLIPLQSASHPAFGLSAASLGAPLHAYRERNTSLLDVGIVVTFGDRIHGWRAFVTCIGAQIVLPCAAWNFHHHLVQRSIEQFYIMCVCAAGDER